MYPTPSEAQGEILYYCWRIKFHNAKENSKFILISPSSQTAALKLLSRNKGAFKLLYKHLNQNEHISKVQCSPASRRPACEAQMSREKADLCF